MHAFTEPQTLLNGLTCARLRFPFAADRLQAEVAALPIEMWQPHSAQPHAHIIDNSDWFGISLTSSTGRHIDDHAYRSAPIGDCNRLTDIAAALPYAVSLAAAFSPITRCRFFRLRAGAVIQDHTDDNLQEYALARLIFPVFAQPGCRTIMERYEVFEMRPGECWFMNDGRMHRVENQSGQDRIVMVVQTFSLARVAELIE